MIKRPIVLSILTAAALATLGATACTTTTVTDPSASATPDAAPADDPDAGDVPATDSGADATKGDGTIGTRSDKGTQTVNVNFSSHGTYSCGATCTNAGGTCKEGGGNGVGWVDRKYNNNSGTFSNQISGCTDTESYASGNTTMTNMDCYCSDMPAPPTIRVRKSEGLFTCTKVCTSWSLKCSATRKGYSYVDEVESSSTALDCTTVPAATSHHYMCSCDK
jgi:hypothetical protein